MIRISTNTNRPSELLYGELSHTVTGLLYKVHNELGSYAREKQYGDLLGVLLKGAGIAYQRELRVERSGNVLDFVVDGKIVIELKSKRMLTKDDYEQTQRYLQETQLKLALLVNFRNKYIKPTRIVRIDNFRNSISTY